jgi:hypothetical protein
MAADEPGEQIESGTIDRRTALRRGAVGAGVAGALWVAPSIVGHDAAFAGSSCAQKDLLDWAPYAGSAFTSKTYPAISSFSALTVTHSAATVVGTGVTAVAPNDVIEVASAPFGGQSAAWYQVNMDTTTANTGYNATFTFSQQVWNLKFSLFDLDLSSNSWTDVVWISGTFTGFATDRTGWSTPATYSGSGTVGSPWTGTASAPSSSSTGNVNVTMATCTTFTINFRSKTWFAQQRIGMGNLTWCR